MDELLWDDDLRVWHWGTTELYRFDIAPFFVTTAIFVGRLDNPPWEWYTDRWCYEYRADAVAAIEAWDLSYPETEPEGWVKHPETGRYRKNGDPLLEIHT